MCALEVVQRVCREELRPHLALVPSSATALAPFSQNSAVCRCPGSGSGHAHPGQSNPSTWLSFNRLRVARRTPIDRTARSIDTATAGTPAAASFRARHLELRLVDVVDRRRLDQGHPATVPTEAGPGAAGSTAAR